MGKAEVARMPVSKQTTVQLMYVSETEEKTKLPPNLEVLKNQVAGHMDDGKCLGK